LEINASSDTTVHIKDSLLEIAKKSRKNHNKNKTKQTIKCKQNTTKITTKSKHDKKLSLLIMFGF